MKILFRAYFHQKKFRKKLAENLLGSGSGSGSGRFRKSDPDPVKNRPDPQHCFEQLIMQKLMQKFVESVNIFLNPLLIFVFDNISLKQKLFVKTLKNNNFSRKHL
jgi:hypothetical protein